MVSNICQWFILFMNTCAKVWYACGSLATSQRIITYLPLSFLPCCPLLEVGSTYHSKNPLPKKITKINGYYRNDHKHTWKFATLGQLQCRPSDRKWSGHVLPSNTIIYPSASQSGRHFSATDNPGPPKRPSLARVLSARSSQCRIQAYPKRTWPLWSRHWSGASTAASLLHAPFLRIETTSVILAYLH